MFIIEGVDNLKTLLVVLAFSSARIATICIIAPFFGPQFITGIARNIVIFNLSLIVVPHTLAGMPETAIPVLEFILIILKEMVLGLLMAFLVAIAFSVVEGMGSFVDTQRGSSMNQLFDPMMGETSTEMGMFFLKIFTLVFYVGGGMLMFFGFVYKSYVAWPIFSFYPSFPDTYLTFYLEVADLLYEGILLFAGPVIIVLFLTEFGLGMVNRFAPQLNVFSLSMPIKSAMGAFMFILYMQVMPKLMQLKIIEGQALLKQLEAIIS